MCGRTFCDSCGQEMIHRDHRRSYESASGFGQIVSREGPVQLTVGDVDLYVRKWLRSKTLLRLVEHKQPDQALKDQQARALVDLDALIRHATTCPEAPLKMDRRSGVFVLRGEIEPATTRYQETTFAGPQTLYKPDESAIATLPDAETVFAWMEGRHGGPRRGKQNNGRATK